MLYALQPTVVVYLLSSRSAARFKSHSKENAKKRFPFVNFSQCGNFFFMKKHFYYIMCHIVTTFAHTHHLVLFHLCCLRTSQVCPLLIYTLHLYLHHHIRFIDKCFPSSSSSFFLFSLFSLSTFIVSSINQSISQPCCPFTNLFYIREV